MRWIQLGTSSVLRSNRVGRVLGAPSGTLGSELHELAPKWLKELFTAYMIYCRHYARHPKICASLCEEVRDPAYDLRLCIMQVARVIMVINERIDASQPVLADDAAHL